MNRIGFFHVLGGLLCAVGSFAHEGHQHAPPVIAMPAASGHNDYSVSGRGGLFEATLRHGVFIPGEMSAITLFLAEWTTNAPVSGADVMLEVIGPDLAVSLTPVVLESPGQYQIELALPTSEPYAVLVEVNRGADFDLIPVDGLRAPGTTATAEAHDPADHGLHLHAGEAFGVVAAGVLLLLGAYFLGHWQGRRVTREVTS